MTSWIVPRSRAGLVWRAYHSLTGFMRSVRPAYNAPAWSHPMMCCTPTAISIFVLATPAAPTPLTPYQRARTQFFYAQTLRRLGQYDRASDLLNQVLAVFPRDRNVHNELGQILFREAQFDAAIQQFQQTLAIDPEDLTAHYQLMLCFRGKGDLVRARQHQALYFRFKADETTTHIRGPYERAHPEDNNEAQPVHEHEG